jgi:hypothetical protein
MRMSTSHRNRTLVRLSALLFAASPLTGLRAQDCAVPSTIAADRPGNLTGPVILPRGHQQLEIGWSHARTGDDRTETVGASLLRVGVSCNAELRVGLSGWSYATSTTGPRNGLGDAWLGTKLRLAQNAGLRPELSAITGALIPTHSTFSHREVEPELNLTAAWALPSSQGLLVFVGAAQRASDTDMVTEQLRGISWSRPVGRAATFLEYSEFSRPGSTSRMLGTGLTLFPHAAMQIDGSVLVPLPRAGADVIVGFGLSRRW